MTKEITVMPMPFLSFLEKDPHPLRLELFANGSWQEWGTYGPDPDELRDMMDAIGKLIDVGFWMPATMRVLEVIDDD